MIKKGKLEFLADIMEHFKDLNAKLQEEKDSLLPLI